ncbi:MAG: 2-oxoacid:acceptor oxidoreductase family protein [Candidatus Ratteibacteria bacterium]|nr:2-oxoacid:acceptor oxidoreductase family protein [Candidatus Ratteibacteria bacterium]
MKEQIICAGAGGQGIVTMGKILAWAALKDEKFVTFIPSYGAEMRGGTANCSVIISEGEIASPSIETPSSLIIMNNASLNKFESRLAKNGLLIVNSSLLERKITRKDIRIIQIPATEIAEELGQIKMANMVALGAYIGKSKIIPLKKLEESLISAFPKVTKEILALNIKALRKGEEIGSSR